MFGATVDAADGDHGGVTGLHFPAHDRLQGQDDLRGMEHDRIFAAKMRHGAVAAHAPHGDVHRVHMGQGVARGDADAAVRQVVIAVERRAEVLSGLGNLENRLRARSNMSRAPVRALRSSAGWPIITSVPLHWSRSWLKARAVPTRHAMWMSWPQACMTGTSAPASSLVMTVLA